MLLRYWLDIDDEDGRRDTGRVWMGINEDPDGPHDGLVLAERYCAVCSCECLVLLTLGTALIGSDRVVGST
jgi:hypothetical protein